MVYPSQMSEDNCLKMPNGYPGQLTGGRDGGQFGAIEFLVQQMLARCNTIDLVKVIAVRPIGSEPDLVADPDGLLMIGAVDVQMMVNMVNGGGEAVEHSTLYNLPYFRLQGGGSAVKLDPIVGDIGIAAFCARDISVVKETKEVANPGSWGRFSISDGVYLGGILNDNVEITQYIEFGETGVKIVSPVAITLIAPPNTIFANGNMLG